MLELKGYITNLGKYNEGYLVGKWIDFPITQEELEEVYKEIGINAQYEEYFFSDWDCEVDLELGEYESIDKLNELADQLQGWDIDTLKAARQIWSMSEILEKGADSYYLINDIDTVYDVGYYYAIECCSIDFGENDILQRYFDFEAYGRDILVEVNGGLTIYGYVECME